MLFLRIGIVVLALVGAAGCLSSSESDRAFSHDWADKMERERVFAARQAYVHNDAGSLLKLPGGKALLRIDEKGKPRLNWGVGRKLRLDINLRAGRPAGVLKYQIKW